MHRLGIVALVAITLLPMLGLGRPRPVRALANPASAAPFVVRPDGARGPLVAYDQQTGNEVFRLPPGMISADGARYFAATPSEHGIWLETYDTTTGRALRTEQYDGDWTIGGVSHSGRWVVLAHLPGRLVAADSTDADLAQTAILVVDADRGSVAHEITLDGDFAVETISATGDALFLIEHLAAAGPGEPAPYLVRVYDLALDFLDPNPLRDKRFLDELMTGQAWDGLASPDGQWLLTLYVNTTRDRAFIHTLNLRERYAICLDLPTLGGSVEQLAAYSLTLAPDGRRAYAINPVLGVVAELNLVDVTVGRSTMFEPVPTMSSTLAVVSPDGDTIFFASGRDLWRFQPASRVLDRLPSVVAPVVGLSLSISDDQLLVVAAEGPIARIDAAGNLLAFSERGAA